MAAKLHKESNQIAEELKNGLRFKVSELKELNGICFPPWKFIKQETLSNRNSQTLIAKLHLGKLG